MKLLTFEGADHLRLGVKVDAGVIDVAAAAIALNTPHVPGTIQKLLFDETIELAALQAFIARAEAEAAQGSKPAWLLDESKIKYGAPVPNPEKIICVGLNYRRHAEEGGNAIPTVPVLFSKYNNTIAANGEAIALPSGAEQIDYEAELVVVIGKTAKNISQADALDYVFGYCCGNDISARDLQYRTAQWMLGKIPDHFFPFGPYLVTADEVGDPQALTIKGYLNGELRQNSTTADMIFSVAEVIAYITQYVTLKPGDVISTGTPEGVIMGKDPKIWMKAGDEYTIEIDKLGRLSNTMA